MLRQKMNEDTLEVIIGNSEKPIAHSNRSFPYNNLDDRAFEILLYRIFKSQLSAFDNKHKTFDNIDLMQGVGEKGMDSVLTKDGKCYGLIQCKKYGKKLTIEQSLKEIIKFCLYYLLDNNLAYNLKEFKYYLAVSSGFSGNAIHFLNDFKTNIKKQDFPLEEWTNSIIKKFSTFKNFEFDDIKTNLLKILSQITIEKIIPEDIDLWVVQNPELLELFFEIKTVTDNKIIIREAKEINNKINSISSQLQDLHNVNNLPADSVINQYRDSAIEKLNIVNFIGFDLHKHRQKPNEIKLTDLFVKPKFHLINKEEEDKKTTKNKELSITQVFLDAKHIVVLGDPGAGKSLLIKYLLVKLLQKNSEDIGLKKIGNHIPFRIELRKYNEERNTKSVLEYLSGLLSKEYQINLSSEKLNNFLLINPSLFFFDGLDEIFDLSHKLSVKETIEQFITIYPLVKCILTSRFIGYHDVKFDSNHFNDFSIINFKHDQQIELINKFYTTQILNQIKRREYISSCITELNEIDEDLKSNPLILSLILILYQNNLTIPDSKLEVYEACTNTLVDTLDANAKELKINLKIKNKRRTFGNLAYWQYKCLTNNEMVTHENAIKITTQYLLEKEEFDDFETAEEAAKEFLKYAERRSIYFEDNFTHKTFLEFFTADFIYIKFQAKNDIEGRDKIISEYIANPFWNIVFELLIAKIDKDQEDYEILDKLIKKQLKTQSKNLLYFLAQNLKNIKNISDDLRYDIIKRSIVHSLNSKKLKGDAHQYLAKEESSIFLFLKKLINYDHTSRILSHVFHDLEKDIKIDTELTKLYIFYYEIMEIGKDLDISFPPLYPDVVEKLSKKNKHLYNLYAIQFCKEPKKFRKYFVEQITLFGKDSIFDDIHLMFKTNYLRFGLYPIYLRNVIQENSYNTFESDYLFLRDLGITASLIKRKIDHFRMLYFVQSDGFEKLIMFYNTTKIEEIEQIIFELIQNIKGSRSSFDRIKANLNPEKARKLEKILK